MGHYNHLTIEEREAILIMQLKGASIRRERVKILDNLLRWKERKKRSEIGGGRREKPGRNMTRTSRRTR